MYSVVFGYVGGYVDCLSYCVVCNGNIGYVEVVVVKFDLVVILYCEIFDIFFVIYDLIIVDC